MSLDIPEIDNRDYDQLFAEALARIPIHNPEWTNFNDADAGITLLQLFSFMTENLLYRSRQIPERNRLKFLELLGIEREPANPAVGMVVFDNLRGQTTVEVLDEDEEVLAGKIPFRTLNGLAVLPIEGRAYIKQTATLTGDDLSDVETEAQLAYPSYLDGSVEPVYYETKAVEWPVEGGDPLDLASTADRALWLALLARSGREVSAARAAIANEILTLGIVPDLTASAKRLPPGGSDTSQPTSRLEYRLPAAVEPLATAIADRVGTYVPILTTSDTDVLDDPGIVQLHLPGKDDLGLWDLDPTEAGVGNLPPALEGDDAQRLITWIRIRPARSDTTAPLRPDTTSSADAANAAADQARVKLSWLGINAALIEQRTKAVREFLGKGTGQPDQQQQLANTPILLNSVELTVGGVIWERVSDLMTAGSEVPTGSGSNIGSDLAEAQTKARKYTVDRESGSVRFGDGIHGSRPGNGQLIEVSYNYGGGRAGLVAPTAITKGPALPAGVKVNNPLATWGADEAESVAEAERRIPQFVKHRDRLVTQSDFEEIALRTPGVDMGRVEVLPLVVPDSPDILLPGVVSVMVIPAYDTAQPGAPMPDQFFLDAVCRHLDPRRLVTTEIHIRGPEYVPVWLSIGIDVMAGRDIAPVREAVQAAIRAHHSPLAGGVLGTGWPLSTSVERLDAWAVAARVDGVAKVFDVKLTDDSGNERDRVVMAGLELPRLAGLSVQQGDPLPLADLRGEATPAPQPGEKPPLPIPITPAEC